MTLLYSLVRPGLLTGLLLLSFTAFSQSPADSTAVPDSTASGRQWRNLGRKAVPPVMQKRTVALRVSPLGFLNKARVHGELAFGRQASGGLVASYYYGQFKGLKLEPFVRYYFVGRALSGLYLQAKASGCAFNTEYTYNRTITTYNADGFPTSLDTEGSAVIKKGFKTAGGGGGLGYQLLLGTKRNIPLDIYVGLQWMPFPTNIGESFSETATLPDGKRTETRWSVDEVASGDPELGWYTLGPGSVLNGMLSVGIAF
ncbi:DUF3575 domain-containing protein [Hymenobacter sp. BT175]|uniref:DUF3575 domain-containing protein n=1 Tax=Hymenobacter translucens TaxID=2886507 RepID=UPI001D0EB0E8|nr:DUF3575 domain-containing protein [Hymenobacter translucens]MCC2545835.1 DUF3575 domain-containing protein [Hymenobacter translucens]